MSTKFLNLNTDTTLGGSSPSDDQAVSQKAIKTYVDANAVIKNVVLNEGTVLNDTQGYNDLTKYLYDTFDINNFNIVGSPTITSDGIASGFSSSNYLTSPTIIDTTKTWKAQLTLTTPTLGTSQVVLQLSQYFYLVFSGTKQLSFRTTNNTQTNWITTTSVLSDNTEYDIEFGWNGSKIFLNYKPSNGSWVNKSQTPGAYSGVSNATLESLGFGLSSYPFNGTIDLKGLSITVDNLLVFTGNKFGTDTYTINNSDVTIPYRISLTGDKVADSALRTNIHNAFLATGLAPYFTVDTENKTYTLPQGELYGMFVDRTMPHIVNFYQNGTSGYMLFSNNFLIQWGETDTVNIEISLIKSYNNKNYRVWTSANLTQSYQPEDSALRYIWDIVVSNIDINSFWIMIYESGLDPNHYCAWFALGFVT